MEIKMPNRSKLHRVRSAAGRAGGIARWANVEREPTVQVRVFESDADWLKSQDGTVAQAVRNIRNANERKQP